MVKKFKWSIANWHRLVETGVLANSHTELIAGEIVETNPEEPLHSYSSHKITNYLQNHLAEEKHFVREGHPITLDFSEPQPDIVVLSTANRIEYKARHPIGSEISLIIEISHHTLSFDLNQKKDIYLANDIKEYWVVDLLDRKLIAHRNLVPERAYYHTVLEVNSGEISPLLIDDCSIEVAKLFP